jgi:hypothetical protein
MTPGKEPTMSLNLNDVRSEALFASALQPSDEPTPAEVRAAITVTVRRLGTQGCAARMAQEFGDEPQSAVNRMRWARQVIAASFAASPVRRSAPVRVRQLAGACSRAA